MTEAQTPPSPLEPDYDVVVVGSGGGALTGAALAARAGLRTLVLERTPLIGGTSAYSGGACWLPGSAVQQRAGLPDSTEGARSYLGAVLDHPDPAKVEALLAHAPELVAELEADPLMDFEWIPFSEYYDAPGRVPMGRSIQPVPIRRDELDPAVAALVRPPVERDRVGAPGRSTLSGGQALIARLAAIVVREGGTIATGHHVTGLARNADRRVDRVRAHGPDGPVEVRAIRGVLVAAGGFEGSAERRKQRGTPGRAEWTMAPRGTNTGEVIDAAVAVGAATDYSGEGWFCPGLEHPDGSGSFTLGFRGGLMVDQHARRYGNECLPYDRFGRLMAAAPERIPSWFVFDDREGGRLPAIAMPEGEASDHLAAGTWVRADTVEGLAEAAGLDAAALTATVERFNRFAAAGTDDDFRRGDDEYDTFFAGSGSPNKALVPVDRPPFYAARFVLSDLGTKGGLVTDASGRVVDDDGSPIPGLYAASNSTASVFGSAYPGPGAPLGAAMTFASLAVRDMRS
ncbi:succinate dehydrogenase/fumarate reductase flavoprotein subunit [Nocardioides thalensis]|uniref:Succinate dehydrogenase/fumarate reductase flavoprotein subunit n=1 Tax=Nocardioides thalensis TaxID=1914755 RepID=A0A853C2K5_9ACTN|nr:succinate dehydrogenase/fumarate reductase flavoprotein subunit [Nocardioides thalensis]